MLAVDDIEKATLDSLLVAAPSLGYSKFESSGRVDTLPDGLVGGHITLAGDDVNLLLGVVTSPEGCQTLALTMLGMEPEDGPLAEDELSDALGELANVFGGQVKTILSPQVPGMQIGLPMFVSGRVDVPKEQSCRHVKAKIDDVDCIVSIHVQQASAEAA